VGVRSQRMAWSNDTMKALNDWPVPDTAFKKHPIDDVRFYVFVGHVWRDIRRLWDESQVRDILKGRIEEMHSDWRPDLVEETVERARSEGTLLLDFLCGLRDTGKLKDLIG